MAPISNATRPTPQSMIRARARWLRVRLSKGKEKGKHGKGGDGKRRWYVNRVC